MELITFDYLFFIYLGIFFLGGLVKGTIGVGLPTVTLTLLSFFFDIKDSISFILIPVILTNLVQMLDGKELKSIFQQTKFFLITSVVFVIPGFLILRTINSNTILLILASLLVLNSCLVLFNKIITIKRHTSFQTQFWIGALTGITTGVTSIYTMPFIFLIQSLKLNKEKLIQLMGLSFFLYSLTQFTLFYSFSMINEKVLLFSSVACAPIIFGVISGKYLRKVLSEKAFRLLFNYMLLISGIVIIIKSSI
ncbi:sulfite exporter TauE/SafE family protein [Pelagibacteraceae bacterium]|nr:sulfite exporter TauE/SafE family protein [Pelagibacteraceae bacterium]MDC0412678.1 sulfite exporter TauE/SafE family protein [Pelagibacteraceae bacterium]